MEAAGGHYRNIGNESTKVEFDPDFASTVSVSRAILEADLVISLPKFKTHGLTVVSGAIKNSYGLLPGAQKAGFHRIAGSSTRFQELIVDVFRLRVPDLFIVDAVLGMEGNGPASPDLRDIGLVLASDNAVALDAVIATMMGLDPARLRFLQKARDLGLGDFDLDGIDILGELRRLPGFKVPPLGGEAIQGDAEGDAFFHGRADLRPQADPALCTGCGACVERCPVSALSQDGLLPQVDPEACIACFCCQEICPEKAMTLS
jgi:ferredoxin